MTVSFLTHEHAQRKDNRKSVLHKDIMKYELHKKTIYLEVSISFLVTNILELPDDSCFESKWKNC